MSEVFALPLVIFAFAVMVSGWPSFITINKNYYYKQEPEDDEN